MRIFVSYHTPDSDAAKAIADGVSIRRPDAEIFFAPRALTGGAYWLPRLAEEVGRSEALLLIIGKRIGPWQEIEYYEAMRLAKTKAREGKPLIVPVIISDQAPGLPFLELHHQIFTRGPTGYDAVEAILKALDGVASDQPPHWTRINPYKGLTAFTSADSAFFFGREALTAEILRLMQDAPGQALALIGSSGVGKSSIAQAGVMAALKSQIWPGGGDWPAGLAESRRWLTVTIRPEDKPLKALTHAFARLVFDETFRQDAEAEGWAQRFRDGADWGDFSRAVKHGLSERLAAEAPARFVLYVDQGEELYASTERDGKQDAAAKRDAEAFSRVITEAATSSEFSLLFSLRSDYYGRLQADETLFAVTHRVDVPPMPVEALRQAIERPAAALGVRFQPTEMPGFLAGATAREAGALPLLAYLLSDMWKEMQARGDGLMRFDERPEVFDVSAALRDRAERYRGRNKLREGDLKRLFTLRLAQVPRLGDVIKRRARRAECAAEEWRIAEELAGEDWRLVTLAAESGGGEISAEVAHEQLLRKWPTLEGWLSELRDFLTWKSEIEAARMAFDEAPDVEKPTALLTGRGLLIARQWFGTHGVDLAPYERSFIEVSIRADDQLRARAHAQERKILKRTRAFAVVTSLLALAAVAVGLWALREKTEAVKQEAEAYEQRTQAEIQKVEAIRQKSEADKQRDGALITQSRFLASEARRQRDGGDVPAGLLLAISALPDLNSTDSALRNRPYWYEAEVALEGARRRWRPFQVIEHGRAISSAAFSPDGRRIVTVSDDKTARVWDAESGKPVGEPMAHDNAINSAAFSPDGRRIVTASEDKTARVWDAETGKPVGDDLLHGGGVRSAAFSPDGRRIVTASEDKTARLWDADTGKPVGNPIPHENAVNSAAFSPDGRRIVTISKSSSSAVRDSKESPSSVPRRVEKEHGWNKAVALLEEAAAEDDAEARGEGPETAQVWDLESAKRLGKPMLHRRALTSVDFSPDGRRIVTASFDHTARVWDAETGKPLGEPMHHERAVASAAFSPDGLRIVTASQDKTARVWDGSGKPLSEPMRHGNTVLSAAFSPDGQRIVTASGDRTARVWDAETGKPAGEPIFHPGIVLSAAFSADGRRIVTAADDKFARVWDAEMLEVSSFSGITEISPDGHRVITTREKVAQLWNAVTMKPIGNAMIHGSAVTSASFSRDGRRVLTTSRDNTARLWDAETGKAVGKPMPRDADSKALEEAGTQEMAIPSPKKITGAAVGDKPDKEIVVPIPRKYIGGYEEVTVIDQPEEVVDVVMEVDGRYYTAPPPVRAAFSPDGRRVVTVSEGETIQVWDSETGRAIGAAVTHRSSPNSTALSPDGRFVLTVSEFEDHAVSLWDSETGKPLARPMNHEAPVQSVGFSPDGHRIVTASGNTARVWDTETGKPLGKPMLHGFTVASAAFSPDGHRIFTLSGNTVQVWGAESGNPVGEPMKHEENIQSAGFSPDGRRIVTASGRNARVWDAETGKPLSEPMAHRKDVLSAAFSPDGRSIVTLSEKLAHVWLAFPNTQALVDDTKPITPVCLTPKQRAQYYLAPEPPEWCITGSGNGLDAEADFSKWQPKWPYRTRVWQEWLIAKRAGKTSPLPAE